MRFYKTKLSKKHAYYPTYVQKMEWIKKIINQNKGKEMLDVGSRDGTLGITSIDIKPLNDKVLKMSATDLKFEKNKFDVVF